MLDRHPGLILSRLVRALGYWPRHFAEHVGIPFQELMALYRAERSPTRRERRVLARALYCTPFGLQRLYAQHLGETIETCEYPRHAEPLPWELRRLEPERYDAAVIVYPNFDETGENLERHRERFVAALDRAAAQELPVFVEFYGCRYDETIGPLLAERGVMLLPLGLRGYWREPLERRHRQRTLDAVARRLGKETRSLRLAFGGSESDHCVCVLAETWCRRVTSRWGRPGGWTSGTERVRRRAARGDLVDDLMLSPKNQLWSGTLGHLGDKAYGPWIRNKPDDGFAEDLPRGAGKRIVSVSGATMAVRSNAFLERSEAQRV